MQVNLGADRARSWASWALGVCAAGMVVTRILEDAHWSLGFLRAFFEAATIGALADWFAVVALFRHPLGVPIPHTAVLPNNKGRVADSLADFLEAGFLTEAQLGPRFRSIDYATVASSWLDLHAGMLAGRAAEFVPGILDGISDEEMSELLASRARHFLARTDLSAAAGSAFEVLLQNGRDREIFIATLAAARELVAEHRETIQSKIREEIPLPSELLGAIPILNDLARPRIEQLRDTIASTVARKTIEKVQGTLDDAMVDLNHPLYASFLTRMTDIIADLKSSSDLSAKVHALHDSIQVDPAIDRFAKLGWLEIKSALAADCAAPDSVTRERIAGAIRSVARHLVSDEPSRTAWNSALGEQVLANVLAAKPHIRELVTSTINAWDTDEMAQRLEKTVGRDLQFIRLNGTLVGGLIGLLIHLAFFAFER